MELAGAGGEGAGMWRLPAGCGSEGWDGGLGASFV